MGWTVLRPWPRCTPLHSHRGVLSTLFSHGPTATTDYQMYRTATESFQGFGRNPVLLKCFKILGLQRVLLTWIISKPSLLLTYKIQKWRKKKTMIPKISTFGWHMRFRDWQKKNQRMFFHNCNCLDNTRQQGGEKFWDYKYIYVYMYNVQALCIYR